MLPDVVGPGPSSHVGPAVHLLLRNNNRSESWAGPNNNLRLCGSSLATDHAGVTHFLRGAAIASSLKV
jgi:hypothetical protein